MRTTINLDEKLMKKAMSLSNISKKPALMREALQALIERESARRLALLGGSEPDIVAAPRRQPV